MASPSPTRLGSILNQLQSLGSILASFAAIFVAVTWLVGEAYFEAYYRVVNIPINLVTRSVWDVVRQGWSTVLGFGTGVALIVVGLPLGSYVVPWLLIDSLPSSPRVRLGLIALFCVLAVLALQIGGSWILIGVGASMFSFGLANVIDMTRLRASNRGIPLTLPKPIIVIIRVWCTIFVIGIVTLALYSGVRGLEEQASAAGTKLALSSMGSAERRIATITTHFQLPNGTTPLTAITHSSGSDTTFVYANLTLLLATNDRLYFATAIDPVTCRPIRVIALDEREIINSSWILADPLNLTCSQDHLTPTSTP